MKIFSFVSGEGKMRELDGLIQIYFSIYFDQNRSFSIQFVFGNIARIIR